MAIDYKEIGSNIKVCRIRKNLKQAQLAEIVGVSSQHLSISAILNVEGLL